MGFAHGSKFPHVEEVRQCWNGALSAADFNEGGNIVYIPRTGFIGAGKTLGPVVQAAVDRDVKYEVVRSRGLMHRCHATVARTAPLLSKEIEQVKF
ncbi:hypothetical protein EDB80DRAFT_735400 [Ilyonectria destructans]|nr:hypothetical protein BKA56DRAFT_606506 [Ilyonectria sp. MPI-CAGE-AT-0026]KAH6983795.1 hypothetical protein EDB80DRAFT_735400 [Ilyonectria destructans]